VSGIGRRTSSRAAIDPQAMVSMMLPSALVELLEGLEFEPPRSAIELSMNDEIIDWADSALVEDDVPVVVPVELEVLPVRALIRL
jgi:hypothetical protein